MIAKTFKMITKLLRLDSLAESEVTGAILALAIGLLFSNKFFANPQNLLFISLFAFRYLRLVVHLYSFWFVYKPSPLPGTPSLHSQDCTIIIPTVEPENDDFLECLRSCLENHPREILIVVVGSKMVKTANRTVGPWRPRYRGTKIRVLCSNVANKRLQVALAIPHVQTAITVLLDDHVFWPSTSFLPIILAPFEDPEVGVVGTNKRVRKTDRGFNKRSFWNMLGALYLERHNFEIRATNALDGGVFVISGRTSAHRSKILQDPAFLDGFTNERFFFGCFGPLNADDDNFITRWEVSKGWKIKIQYSRQARIETTLGTYPKFLSQCLRWARTTWRSNFASLFTDRTVWTAQPWCVYSVYISSLVNFALFYDLALVWALSQSTLGDNGTAYSRLVLWILASKMVKLTAYFLREPLDLVFLPGYLAFAYYHSFVKLYAGLTFWVTAWGGRNLAAIERDSQTDNGQGSDSQAIDYPDRWFDLFEG